MLCCVMINSVVLNLVCPFFSIFIFIYDMYFVVTSNATKHEIHTNKILTALVIFMIMHMEGKSFRYCCCWFALETLRLTCKSLLLSSRYIFCVTFLVCFLRLFFNGFCCCYCWFAPGALH